MAKDTPELTSKIVQQSMHMTGDAPAPAKALSLNMQLAKMIPEIQKTLASSEQDATRFARICLSVARSNGKLFEAANKNPPSFFAACMDIAAVDLDPAIPNEAYLVPYGDEVTPQYGYKGLAKLAIRAGKDTGDPLTVLRFDTIRKNDIYDRSSGLNVNVIHKYPPFGEERGPVIGYYALYETASGRRGFVEMTVDEVEKHQARYSKAAQYKSSPFFGGKESKNFDAYGLKTCLRRLINRELPMSKKLAAAMLVDVDNEDDNFGAIKVPLNSEPLDVTPEKPKQEEKKVEEDETHF